MTMEQWILKQIDKWQKTLSMFRVLSNEFVSMEGDKEFVGLGIQAMVDDLEETTDHKNWDTLRVTNGKKVVELKLSLELLDADAPEGD